MKKLKDSQTVKREAERMYESRMRAKSPEVAAICFVGGRILDALALVLKKQEEVEYSVTHQVDIKFPGAAEVQQVMREMETRGQRAAARGKVR